ncbi:uncharacterized protein [Labrus bergylta]|uniref:uncharacterized protein n=1 Tax=Labrus bergylta TaxID=56723 RepID=UPI003313D27E
MENERPQLTPEQDALEHIFACKDKPFLEGRYIDASKGRGLFTLKAIDPSMFVVEYRGNIYSVKTTTPKKECPDSLINYLFEFSWSGAQWCIDASAEDRTLGRLVNDDHISPNCEMKKIVIEGKPHLCLFAVKKISLGQEITFNYGDSSYPWRSTESFDGSSSSYTNVCASTSTPRNKGLEDWEAASSDNDDDDLRDSGPSCDRDSFSNTSSQMDFVDDSSLRDLVYPEEMTGKSAMPPANASCSRKDKKAPLSSDKPDADGEYATKSFCYFCGKAAKKMARHLSRHVEEDSKLAEAFSLQINSKERNRILADFRNKGNHKHNQEVLKNDSGALKLRRRRKNKGSSSKTFLHCMYCKSLLMRKEMWRHVRRCPARSTSDSATSGKSKVLGAMAVAEAPLAQNLSADVKKILSDMTQDRIAFAVQNDVLLIKLTEHLSAKYRDDPDKRQYIRQTLREMGRLLLALHEKSISSYQDAIKPTNFYKVVDVVKKLAGFNVKRKSYEKPSLALKFGYSLKKIGAIVAEAEDLDEQMKGDAERFVNMCTEEWTELVSRTALASLKGQRINKASTIPFTRDVQLFYRYIESASVSAVKGLKSKESKQVYTALCRVTLARVSVLNKCAPEVSKMTLKAFQERDDSTQVLSKHFIRINMENITGQNISLLLTSDLVSAINLLVSKRNACGVHKDNPFLFAMPNSSPTSLFHKGHNIRAFSILCRAKNPEHLRGVHFHKHISRVFQILNLENDELDHLAKLLGHNIRADRDYYRLPEAAVELAKIATLIVAMEKGSLEKFKGKSLTEVEIEDELEPDVEQVNSEISDAEEDDELSDYEESLMEISQAEEQTFNNEDSSHSWGSAESNKELKKSRPERKAAAASLVDKSVISF